MAFAKRVLRVLGATSLVLSGSLAAQEFPVKPVRMMIPYDAGGISDIVARQLQPGMAAALGQPVVVENRPGASGGVGTDLVAKGPADGYTILINFDSFATVPYLFQNIYYDPLRDFAAVSPVASTEVILVLHASVPAGSLQEFLALAKSRPGEFNYASSGNGGASHLATEVLAAMAGAKFMHIPMLLKTRLLSRRC